MNEEDEAFEELAKRQGDWGLQGSRKHQIMRYAENAERNAVLEEVAQEMDKFAGPFGRDTVQSFAAFVRGNEKMTQEALKLALDALEQTLQTLDDENAKPGGAIADTIWHSEHETLFDYLGSEITAIKEALAEHAMQEVQRLGQEIEQEPVAWFHPHKGFYWAKPTSISAPTIADVEPLKLVTHCVRTAITAGLAVFCIIYTLCLVNS